MNDSAYSLIPRRQVIDACRRYKRSRKSRIERDREAAVCSLMNRRKYILFGPRYTREEAVDLLRDDIWSEWYMAAVRGGMEANMVLDLLCLAVNSQNDVYVPSHLASVIFERDDL